MANMSTHVQRSWNRLRDAVMPAQPDPPAFRAWLTDDIVRVSKKLPPRLAARRVHRIWQPLFEAPLSTFAIRRAAWDELVRSIGEAPPTFDPVAVLDWGIAELWSLCVFIDPDDTCDRDQYDLELWWSDADRRPAFACQFGHWCAFRRHAGRGPWPPQQPWRGDTDSLRPARRDVVESLYPDMPLVR